MASPPPPYANVTGISRAVMKDSPQESFANYDGNARAGELVVNLDVDPPTLYIGNALGNLNEVTGGNGGSYGNSNVAAYLPNYTGNLSAANITVTGNIIPSANITYNLGNNTNRFNNLYLAGNTIILGNAILSANGSSVTVTTPDGGNFVLQGNANTTFGNIVSVNLDGNSGNVLSGAGTWVAAGGGGNASLPLANGSSNINIATANGNVTITANASNTWTFGDDGLITLPGGYTKIGAQYGSDAILSSNVSFGVATQGNATTYMNWSDDVANTSVMAAIYVNAPNANPGDIHFRTGGIGNANIWQFNADGNLVLPNGNSVIYSIANSSLDPTLPNVSTMTFIPDSNYNSQVLVLDPTAPGHIHLRAHASSNIDEPSANIFLGGEQTAFEVTSGPNNVAKIHSGGNTWTFANNGDLLLASGNSVVSSLPNNAGDGSGLSTLNLYPDSSTGDDRYLIIDPTGPAHLHLRAGGAQDASNVLLYLGGEQTYVQIDDGYHRVSINSYDIGNGVGYNWRFDYNGNLVLPGNTFAVKYANGTQVSLGGLPLANGSSNIDISNANGNVSITANGTNTWTFDTTGNLTLPGNIVGASANVQIAADGFTWTFNNLGVVSNPIVTYSALPSANTAGYRAFISDGNLVATGNFGNAVSGGGSNTVPVYSDGSNWRIG